jgi:hypothetical protein
MNKENLLKLQQVARSGSKMVPKTTGYLIKQFVEAICVLGHSR